MSDAAQGLAIVQRLQGRLDLIITDIMPGDTDGVDLAYSVREQFPAVPVILMSGYADEATTLTCEYPFITKPFHFKTIWEVVERVLPGGVQSVGFDRLVGDLQNPRALAGNGFGASRLAVLPAS